MGPLIRRARALGALFAALLPACEGPTVALAPNTAPGITLVAPEAPPDGLFVDVDTAFTARARAVDGEDPPASLRVRWSAAPTDRLADATVLGEGAPGADGIVEQLVAGLPAGAWQLEVVAVDPDGAEGSARLDFVVLAPDTPPDVSIVSPQADAILWHGSPVALAGVAVDDRGADALEATWRSDVDGTLWTGAPASSGLVEATTSGLTVGSHTITLRVVDAAGATAEASVPVEVRVAPAAPGAPGVAITPTDPRTTDALTCAVTTPSVDPNGDVVSYQFTWLRDGTPTWSQSLLPAAQTVRDELWTCRVVATDGTLDAPPVDAQVTVQNTPPAIASVLLQPTTPTEATVLTCLPQGWADPDGDTPDYTFTWTVDGAPAGAGPSLTGSGVDEGDAVACTVTPRDDASSGPPVASAVATVANSPPGPPQLVLTPSPIAPHGVPLACATSPGADPDPQDVVTVQRQWWRGGLHQPARDGATGVPASAVQLGDDWTCRARSWDGTEGSAWVEATTAVRPSPGDVVITELLADPVAVADAVGEWIELHNASAATLDLGGWMLSDGGTDQHVVSGPLLVPPGGRVVLGRSTESALNGGASVDYELTGFVLDNGADSIVVSFQGQVIDRVDYDLGTWAAALAGHALALDPDLGAPDAAANDAPVSWCGSMAPLPGVGADFGTPGATNDGCACYASDGDRDGWGDHPSCPALDCDDADEDIAPDMPDACEDGVDADCDGADSLCGCLQTDDDGDGYGDGAACVSLDCDDADPAVRPGAVEVCDGIDGDCDGVVDDGFDQDGDGATQCGGDCDDADPNRAPHLAEACTGVDDDCDGAVDEGYDQDGDGATTCAGDCDDADPNRAPGLPDLCGDGDADCDGAIDEDAPGDAYEPNDSLQAATFGVGDDTSDVFFGSFVVNSDTADWFTIVAIDDAQPGCDAFTVGATLDSIPAGMDLNLRLYAPSGLMVAFSEQPGSTPEAVSWSAPCDAQDDGGAWSVQVVRVSGTACGQSYRLTLTDSG